MAEHPFCLIPFPDPNVPDIQLTGAVSRNQNILAVRLVMTGQIEVVFFPETAKHPRRKDNLWKTTCFEFFLAIVENPEYWEFNMSPSGDWNAYYMDAYRQIGLREETSVHQLEFSVDTSRERVIVNAIVDLTPFIQECQQIQVEITSVIEDKHQHETYWALVHPGLGADFHRREGFIIPL